MPKEGKGLDLGLAPGSIKRGLPMALEQLGQGWRVTGR